MRTRKSLIWVLLLVLCVGAFHDAEAKRKRHRRRRYSGPTPTHPVLLWSRTLSESTDRAQRKIAAFKLSQYSQPIYHDEVIRTLIGCMKDNDVEIKVLCTKAMSHAGNISQSDWVRKVVLERYQADPTLHSTIVRTFISRRDSDPAVQDTFLDSAKKTQDQDELLVLLSYLELYGNGSDKFVDSLSDIYKKNENIKVKRAVVKVLADRGRGQDSIIDIFSQCAESKDTPLALTCLAGLQLQAKKDSRAWAAVEKTILSTDPDVLMATLDVINALPETPNPKISTRLVEIINEIDDSEIQEKAVLAIGAVGDQSEMVVTVLSKLLEDKDSDEAVRIAAALGLGKQGSSVPDKVKTQLMKCSAEGSSASLRTACQLGMQDSSMAQKKAIVAQPTPSATPNPRAPVSVDKPSLTPPPIPSSGPEFAPAPSPAPPPAK